MKQIASIYYDELNADRPIYSGYYRIPAVPKDGKPEFLIVTDKIQRGQEPSADGMSRVMRRDTITAHEIANCLIREWATCFSGATPESGPGVWIVRDEIPQYDENGGGLLQRDADGVPLTRPATDAEKQAMWAEDLNRAVNRQKNWVQYQVTMGDEYNANIEKRKCISPLMRLSARVYGIDRPWLKELRDNDVKKCVFCMEMIPTQTVKCPKCHEVVDPERYAELNALRDAAMLDQQTKPSL